MLYQEKPKELKRLEALYIVPYTTPEDIAAWVMERSNYYDLLTNFKIDGGLLCLGDRCIFNGEYLIYEKGKYRLLNKEVFEEMYEPVQVNETA